MNLVHFGRYIINIERVQCLIKRESGVIVVYFGEDDHLDLEGSESLDIKFLFEQMTKANRKTGTNVTPEGNIELIDA